MRQTWLRIEMVAVQRRQKLGYGGAKKVTGAKVRISDTWLPTLLCNPNGRIWVRTNKVLKGGLQVTSKLVKLPQFNSFPRKAQIPHGCKYHTKD